VLEVIQSIDLRSRLERVVGYRSLSDLIEKELIGWLKVSAKSLVESVDQLRKDNRLFLILGPSPLRSGLSAAQLRFGFDFPAVREQTSSNWHKAESTYPTLARNETGP
jgi:hypothetical protein